MATTTNYGLTTIESGTVVSGYPAIQAANMEAIDKALAEAAASDTTYRLSLDGLTLTLTPSKGTAQSVTLDLSAYATVAALADYAKAADLDAYAKAEDLAGYATKDAATAETAGLMSAADKGRLDELTDDYINSLIDAKISASKAS